MASVDPKFTIGSLVRILPGLDDSQIPKSRLGLIIEIRVHSGMIVVRFPNGYDLDFNEYWLEVVSSA